MEGKIYDFKNMDPWNLVLHFSRIVISLFQLMYWYLEALYRFFVPPPMKSIDGEVILVTGAAGGIGSEICRYIVKCGTRLKLVMWDLNEEELNELAEELKAIGGSDLEVYWYAVDISSRENIDNCCNVVKKEVGSITIIFNNAGIAPKGNFLQLTNHQIEKTIQVNLLSHFWIIRHLLPDMVRKTHGRIVNICSIAGIWGGICSAPYYASKFGVNGYTESLKIELGHFSHHGIHCTTVYPSLVQTKMTGSLTWDKSNPLVSQKMLKPEQVAVNIVDGMRREYEYIYLPSVIPLLRFTEYLTPNKYNKEVLQNFAATIAFTDVEEQKLFQTPLVRINEKGKHN